MIALMSTLSRAVRSGLKPTPSSMNGAMPPAQPDVARVRPVDPREALHQRALAAPVAADDPEELAGLDLEGDVLERVELLVGRCAANGMQDALLERVDVLCGERKVFETPVHGDGERLLRGRAHRDYGSGDPPPLRPPGEGAPL